MSFTSIAVIIPYFGKLPKYFPYFVESALKNEFIDFILITDDENAIRFNKGNIVVYHQSVAQFNELASAKLNHFFVLPHGYKLCDLKPMYGKIYEDYITLYSFWGFSDLDIVFGNLRQILTEELLASHDIISFYELFISGPFCLFRNEEEVNTLFMKSKDYTFVLGEKEYCCFDEFGDMETFRQLCDGTPLLDTTTYIETFSHVVFNPQKSNKRLYARKWITDGEIKKEVIRYHNGHLYFDDTREIYLYHYMWYKGYIAYNIPRYIQGKEFTITKNGFFYEGIKSRTVDWWMCISNNFFSKVKKKIKRLSF